MVWCGNNLPRLCCCALLAVRVDKVAEAWAASVAIDDIYGGLKSAGRDQYTLAIHITTVPCHFIRCTRQIWRVVHILVPKHTGGVVPLVRPRTWVAWGGAEGVGWVRPSVMLPPTPMHPPP